jgi:hypothetical protein
MTLELLKMDLVHIGAYTLRQIPCPYDLTNSWESCIQTVYQLLKSEMSGRNRIKIMAYGYYLGNLIDLSCSPRQKWLEFVQDQHIRNEFYFYRGSIRLYHLFKDNLSQLYQTTQLSYRRIQRLKADEFQQLVQFMQLDNLPTNDITRRTS